MELVSETDEQTTPPVDVTARTRCLATFATPIRERAATDRAQGSDTNFEPTKSTDIHDGHCFSLGLLSNSAHKWNILTDPITVVFYSTLTYERI